jgi:hypothetical protein
MESVGAFSYSGSGLSGTNTVSRDYFGEFCKAANFERCTIHADVVNSTLAADPNGCYADGRGPGDVTVERVTDV